MRRNDKPSPWQFLPPRSDLTPHRRDCGLRPRLADGLPLLGENRPQGGNGFSIIAWSNSSLPQSEFTLTRAARNVV